VTFLRPVSNHEQQPAPNGWRDAYLETMETIWQHLVNPDGYDPRSVATITAFAQEIRQGLTAGLLAPNPPATVEVPLLNVPMRDDQPRRSLDFDPERGASAPDANRHRHDL
jgi:hypothetical protein